MPEDIISLYQSRLIPALLSQVMIHLHSLERRKQRAGSAIFMKAASGTAFRSLHLKSLILML